MGGAEPGGRGGAPSPQQRVGLRDGRGWTGGWAGRAWASAPHAPLSQPTSRAARSPGGQGCARAEAAARGGAAGAEVSVGPPAARPGALASRVRPAGCGEGGGRCAEARAGGAGA